MASSSTSDLRKFRKSENVPEEEEITSKPAVLSLDIQLVGNSAEEAIKLLSLIMEMNEITGARLLKFNGRNLK